MISSLALLCACSGGNAERRGAQEGPLLTPEEQAIQTDRIDEITRVCNRKANIAVPRCWDDEYMRTRKKFEAQVSLLIVVAPDGKAQEVKVVSSSAKSRDLETCLVEAARSWSYPEGKVAAPVHCSFYLKSSM